jgi:hypothetical protein
VRQRRLMLAVAISTGVHLAVLATLVTLSTGPGRPSVLRVRVLPGEGPGAELRNVPEATGTSAPSAPSSELTPRSVPAPARASAAPPTRAPSSVASSTRSPGLVPATESAPSPRSPPAPAAATRRIPDSSQSSSADAERRQPVPVQSDIWVLTPTGEGPADAPEGPGVEGSGHPTEGSAPSPGTDAGASGGNRGRAPAGPQSLLAELGRRLAQSAARCTPSEAARLGWSKDRGLAVPVHFCLDATGRPSQVGLEGTTGSEVLDRAARDCVVPGAVPLPPAPGCYTVPVLFPVRG